MAVTIFNLLHDGGSTKSLLTLLGLRASLRFVSTGRYEEPPGMTVTFRSPALLGIRGGQNGTQFIPQFQLTVNKPETKLVQFETWWIKEDIYDSAGVDLSRRRLVFALRHQDGGAHIGELTDPAYVQVKSGAGMSGVDSNGALRALQGVYPTMRQIAWEVTETLRQIDDVS